MTVRERRYLYYHGNQEDAQFCATCQHFYPHYVRTDSNQYHLISAGHCVHPRQKLREAYDTCKFYETKAKETL